MLYGENQETAPRFGIRCAERRAVGLQLEADVRGSTRSK